MNKSKIVLLGLGLLFSPLAYSKKDQYQAPSLPLKKEKAMIKVQKDDLESPKKFGQFESSESSEKVRERELAGNDDAVSPDLSSGQEPKQPVFMPERMRWKEKRN